MSGALDEIALGIAGDRSSALPLLAEAIGGESGFRAYARQDADFDPIRDTPRFQALVGTGGEDTGP